MRTSDTERGIPVPELGGGLPFVGHALAFHRDPVGLIQRGRDLYGDVFALRLFGRVVHVLTGPSGNAAFFKAPDTVLSAREAYRFTIPIFGEGLVYDASPELMDEQLRMVHPALRDEKMQSYAGYIEAEVEDYLDGWGEAGTADLLTAMNEITIRTAGRCLIGAEFRGELAATFARLYRDLEGGINMVAFFAPHFPLPAMRRRDRARREVVKLLSPLIAAARAGRTGADGFLGTLVAARGPDGEPLNDEAITGLLLALLFAGQHTSAALATWAGLLLLSSPRSLAAVLQEQETVMARQGMTLAALKQLTALESCLKETERLHPPLVVLMRKVLEAFVVEGRVFAPGDLVMVSPAVSHRIPQVFCNPERFDPQRFLPPREEDRRTPYSLIGFGGGKHRCIGLAFAYQQIKVILSVILRRYTLELLDADHRPNYETFVVGPRQPCRIRFCRRRSAATSGSRTGSVAHVFEQPAGLRQVASS